MILFIGNKYKLSTKERCFLEEDSHEVGILEPDSFSDDLMFINKIEHELSLSDVSVIVLNNIQDLEESILLYIENLKDKRPDVEVLGIEYFLEKYLYKCYIPEYPNDRHLLSDIHGFTWFQTFRKRIIDYFVVFFLLLLFPFLRVITKFKIDKESPGSLYFKQPRVGLNNKIFECIKFRTMHEHDCTKDVRTATKGDSRVFPWGRVMRKTRIDEVPQLFNILRGELHVIGPRAEWVELAKEYEKEIPYYNLRHVVTPGLSGWAQVMFEEGRHREHTKDKLMYDLYYIKHWSLRLEFKIAIKTLSVMVRGVGH